LRATGPPTVPEWNRRRVRRLAAAWIILAAALAAQLDSASGIDTTTTEAAEKEIRGAIENWRFLFNAGNEEQVCDLFAPDLVANYQDEPERDYSSLCEMLRTALRDREANYTYSVRINEIMVYGEAAVVRLVWTLEIDKAGTPKQSIEEPAVDIFRRQADGSWKISRYLAYPASR
jgi:ketosteroid isomerase-like protein